MNTFKNILCGLSIALIFWIGVSFLNVVAYNNLSDPVYSRWNFFSVMLELADNNENIRTDTGVVISNDSGHLEIMTEDGNIWVAQTGAAKDKVFGQKVTITFDTLGTVDIKDDIIIKIH